MKITPTQNKNTNKPSFNGHIVVELKRLPAEMQPKVLSEVERRIGKGIVQMPYEYYNKTVQNDCFVGFNADWYNRPIDEIVIATGEEESWSKKAVAKRKQVDNVILMKLNSILYRLGMKDPFERSLFIDYERGATGEIEKEKNKIYLTLNKHEFRETHEYEEENGKFNYLGALRSDYDDFDDL